MVFYVLTVLFTFLIFSHLAQAKVPQNRTSTGQWTKKTLSVFRVDQSNNIECYSCISNQGPRDLTQYHRGIMLGRTCRCLISAVLISCIDGSFLSAAPQFARSASRIARVRTSPNKLPHYGETTTKIKGSAAESQPSENNIEARIRNGNRGDRYNAANSTIPTAESASASVSVVPPRNATGAEWKRAWKIGRSALPILHRFDRLKPPDSSLSLACLWWKALSGNDPQSPVYDNNLAYDLLPRGSRIVVGKKLRRFYPRLHHANVEIRTAFLDRAVTRISESVRSEGNETKVRLICLGGGYDVRSIKFRERGIVDKCIELDLPQVVEAKSNILQSKRFRRRRPWLTNDLLPEFHAVDLNNIDRVAEILQSLLASDSDINAREQKWHTIFLFEGVMIYLNEGVPRALLEITSEVLKTEAPNNSGGSLCFADRLENIPGGDIVLGREELARNGWDITEWQPKPGLARHMGCAKPLTNIANKAS